MSDHLKKHLTTQLDLLDESSFQLQNSISDYVQQIKSKAIGYRDNTTDTNMTVKDALVMVATAQSVIFEHVNMMNETIKTKTESKSFISAGDSETIRRLKDIEATLASLQGTQQKTEDDISEIKQWRDNFITEQNGLWINIDKMFKKQKHNSKNIRKEIHEQDNRIDEFKKEITDLKERETKTEKALDKLSLDLREYKNNIKNINTEMQVHTDKHVVMCKLLQQKLIPIDKIIETYNQNYETREGKMKKIETLEKEVLKLSQDLQSIGNQQVKPSTLGFIASQGRLEGKMYDGYQIITFSAVERNVGNHFDPKTGVFTAPANGLYEASLTIKKTGALNVGAGVYHKSGGKTNWLGDVWTKSKSVEVSRNFEVRVRLRTGDVLFSAANSPDLECSHFSCSLQKS
ncbi:repetitive organellar protein-like [Physella acuta]|uniref:repetitive organellar protein-like n=1 Tax=Physella acuta TaxID=109671 RepID=UPI0027DE5902|nr:repetitive organellar protein-like [Physella acuta]